MKTKLYVGRILLLLFLALITAIGWCRVPERVRHGQIAQSDLTVPVVHAYRDWQNVGVRVSSGDRLLIEAEGNWSYTPDEFHGPEGHARYSAPDFYPLPRCAGGVLIGRIGEEGEPFIVGKRYRGGRREDGWLYLRINDDLLGDNQGHMSIVVTVEPAELYDERAGYE